MATIYTSNVSYRQAVQARWQIKIQTVAREWHRTRGAKFSTRPRPLAYIWPLHNYSLVPIRYPVSQTRRGTP